MEPKQWGPRWWRFILGAARRSDATAGGDARVVRVLSLVPTVLPCATCMRETKAYLSERDATAYYASGRSLEFWLGLRNLVAERNLGPCYVPTYASSMRPRLRDHDRHVAPAPDDVAAVVEDVLVMSALIQARVDVGYSAEEADGYVRHRGRFLRAVADLPGSARPRPSDVRFTRDPSVDLEISRRIVALADDA